MTTGILAAMPPDHLISFLPTNARIFVESIFRGEKSDITEKDLTADELDAVKRVMVASAKPGIHQRVTQNEQAAMPPAVSHAESILDSNPRPVLNLPPSPKGKVDYGSYAKIADAGSESFGFHNMLSALGRVKTTLGQFGYKKLPSGDVLVGDKYNFGKFYPDDFSMGAKIFTALTTFGYAPLRQYASEVLPEGSGREVKIVIPREQFSDEEYEGLFGKGETKKKKTSGDSKKTASKTVSAMPVDYRVGGRVRLI
jgi:hypothetical protein